VPTDLTAHVEQHYAVWRQAAEQVRALDHAWASRRARCATPCAGSRPSPASARSSR
jgi:hypothetical protein